MSAPDFKQANDYIELKAGVNCFPLTEIKLQPKKKIKIKWDRVIFTLLIIGLGSSWGFQTFQNKPLNKADHDYIEAKALYDQNERKIKAMNRASSVDIIKFRDNCFQLKSLKMPLSPECNESLK